MGRDHSMVKPASVAVSRATWVTKLKASFNPGASESFRVLPFQAPLPTGLSRLSRTFLLTMLAFPLPGGETIPLFPPAPRDLPLYPLDEELHQFVCDVRAKKHPYHIFRPFRLIDDFLLRLRGMAVRITSCTDLDLYFVAMYRLLSDKPDNDRIPPKNLRKFWKDYSLTSRQMAFDNACEDLRLSEVQQRTAYAKYNATLMSSEKDPYVAIGFQYKADIETLNDSLTSVLRCAEACNRAAKECKSRCHQLRKTTQLSSSEFRQNSRGLSRSINMEKPVTEHLDILTPLT